MNTETFSENAKAALQDVQLRGALRHATTVFGRKRLHAAASLDNWEELRSEARAIKDDVLLHLDRYLETFVENAARRGAQFHWARDAAEANDIICGLTLARGARNVVKSKSMTTEEIHLNTALERAGMQVGETDLRAHTIHLAGETP